MKLKWKEHESGSETDVEAVGSGARYYQVWDEGNQFIADVDDCQITYGSKNFCMERAQEHEDGVSSR